MGDMEVTRFGGPEPEDQKPGHNDHLRKSKAIEDNNIVKRFHNRHRGPLTYSTLATRISAAGSLSGLYAILISSVAVVFTMAKALSGQRASSGTYIFVFHMYVYVMAFAFLVFLEVAIRQFKHRQAKADQTLSDANGCISTGIFVVQGTETGAGPKPLQASSSSLGKAPEDKTSEKAEIEYDTIMKKLSRFPAFQFTGEGVNLFALMGLAAFGLGALLLDGFRLIMLVQSPETRSCYGAINVIPCGIRILFIFLQIFSLFKNHKVLINYRHVLIKFGLLHVAAANICTWIDNLVLEAQQSFTSQDHDKNTSSTTNTSHWFHAPPLFSGGGHSGEGKRWYGDCQRKATLYDAASPYLFPFVIEFSLLCAALFYKLYSNIGMTTVCNESHCYDDKLKHMEEYHNEEDEPQCHKANTGLFLGLALLMAVFTAMCVFIYRMNTDGLDITTARIYLISDIAANSCALIAIVPSFVQFSKLHFTGILEEVMDQNLLIVGLCSMYLLVGFLGLAASMQLSTEGDLGVQAKLALSSSVVSFAQATLQVVFIVDALRRRSSLKQETTKPGRSCVTFLLIANLAMWLINTFQLKELHHARLFTEVYGKLPWIIIMHVLLPLTAFFRFHASVCLADIWEKTYSHNHVHTVHLLTTLREPDNDQHT